MSTYAVIDFETTGLSPSYGARPTEIAVVLLDSGKVTQRYQSLMNPGVNIPFDIQALTGITNAMVRKAPSVETVMQEAFNFVGEHPLVAHNASFDSKFWEAESHAFSLASSPSFICTLLLSRRLFLDVPNYKLDTLKRSLRLPDTGKSHRALADAEVTAHLLQHIHVEVERRFGQQVVARELLHVIQKATKAKMDECVSRFLKR